MRRLGRLLFLVTGLAGLQACAAPPATEPVTLRVIIGFTGPVDGAAPATLARLAALSGAEVDFVSSLSPRSHAYRLRCPPDDPACGRALAALEAAHSIDSLSPDTIKDLR